MRSAIFNILSERIARNLRRDFMTSILQKDIEFFDSKRTGDIGKFLRLAGRDEVIHTVDCVVLLFSFTAQFRHSGRSGLSEHERFTLCPLSCLQRLLYCGADDNQPDSDSGHLRGHHPSVPVLDLLQSLDAQAAAADPDDKRQDECSG